MEEKRAVELKAEIEKIEYAMFIEQMADFMDWGAYYKLKAKKAECEKELAKLAA